MTDRDLLTSYGDFLEEADDAALFAVVRQMEQAYLRVQAPSDLMDRIRANAGGTAVGTAASHRARLIDRLFLNRHRPLRPSAVLAIVVGVAVSLLAGAVYAAHVLQGPSGPHVVESCTGFGTRWQLVGPGVRPMSPQQFVASGGRLTPGWRHQVSGLQRPRFWVLPANAHVVDTCRGSSSNQVEIGRNDRAGTQLVAMSVVPLWESNQPTLVGELRLPAWGGCAPKPTTSPVKAPDGRPVAQLAHIPVTLSRSLSVTFTPCNVSKRPVVRPRGMPPPSHDVGFRILSQVQYRGSAGTVVIVTARPTPAAARPGLNLGTPAGSLSNGRRVWALVNDVRWMQGGLIVSVSGNLRISQLKTLAADVVLK